VPVIHAKPSNQTPLNSGVHRLSAFCQGWITTIFLSPEPFT
jgi:hypothetical protein